MSRFSSSRFHRLDFAPAQAWPWWLLCGLLAAMMAIGTGVSRMFDAQREQAAHDASRVQKEQLRRASRDVPPAPSLPKEQVDSVNDAITALNIPWPALLGAIESVRGESVALTLLEPRTQDQRVRLSAQADSMDQLVDFMEQLGRTAPFDGASPLRQELAAQSATSSPNAPMAAAATPRRHQLTFELHWRIAP